VFLVVWHDSYKHCYVARIMKVLVTIAVIRLIILTHNFDYNVLGRFIDAS